MDKEVVCDDFEQDDLPNLGQSELPAQQPLNLGGSTNGDSGLPDLGLPLDVGLPGNLDSNVSSQLDQLPDNLPQIGGLPLLDSDSEARSGPKLPTKLDSTLDKYVDGVTDDIPGGLSFRDISGTFDSTDDLVDDLLVDVDNSRQTYKNPSSGIYYPCPKNNVDCVRKFFARHSECQPVYRPQSDTYSAKNFIVQVPHANVTCIWQIINIVGLNEGEIKTFFINHATKQLLLEVIFPEVTSYSPFFTILYFFRGGEYIELSDFVSYTVRCVSQTVTAPYKNGVIQWKDKIIYTYLSDPYTPRLTGNYLQNAYPGVQREFCTLLNNLPLSIRQAAAFRGQDLYFNFYFNNNVCRFPY